LGGGRFVPDAVVFTVTRGAFETGRLRQSCPGGGTSIRTSWSTHSSPTRATRAVGGGYVLIYSAAGEPFTIDLSKLPGPALVGSWHDPRTGTVHALGSMSVGGARTFTPPTRGTDNDWVLALDAEERVL